MKPETGNGKPESLAELNGRLVRCARGLMSAWARRWRVIRREREARGLGQAFIDEAVKCRETARRWDKSEG